MKSNGHDTTARIRAGVQRHIVGASRVATRRADKAAARDVKGAVASERSARAATPAEVAKPAAVALPAEPKPAGARKLRITEGVLASVRAMRPARNKRKASSADDVSNPFNVYQPPPGVLPTGTKPIAMDEASNNYSQLANWGFDGLTPIGAMFEEGIGFLGYSYLALLTQRPEYRKISERIATEMTREWIELQVTSSDDDPVQDEEATDGEEGAQAEEGAEAGADPKKPKAKAKKPAKKPAPSISGDEDLAAAIQAAIEGGGEGDLAGEEDDKTQKLKELEDELKRLKIKDVFRNVAEQDGWFGRSHAYIDVDDAADKARDSKGADELRSSIGNGRNATSQGKIVQGTKLSFKTVEPMWAYPATYEATNPLRRDWYVPQTWYVNGIEVHRSRLLTFVGRELPDILKPAYAFGGLSLSQMAKPYVDNWLRTRQAVADLIESFSVSGVYTNLAGLLEDGGTEALKRVDMFNQMRSNAGAYVLDKETEEFFNVSTPLGTLDALQAQSQEQMSAVSGIPLVVLLGITPKGLNASSEGEIRVFYDWIHAYQEAFFRDHLQAVIELVQLSLWGEIDEEIGFTFKPLWSMTEKEKGEIDKHEAEADQVRIDSGVLHPEEARKALAAKPGSRYADINVSDVPEPPADPMGEEGADPFGNEKDGEGGDEGGGGDNPFGGGDGASDEAIFQGALDAWEESKHPRADNGQFGEGGGGSSASSEKPAKSGASAKQALKPSELTQVGQKLGSNAGGTFTNKAGEKFYIKKPETKAHVANELAASRLYQLAGVNTLDYRPVEGGEHVATKWESLDKNNIKHMTPAEKKEAAKDFMVHAWLSNWDAAGTGGDNQGIRNGKPVTLDVGGSLRFRAQGGPKGNAFGPKVTEIETMRDAKMSPDAAHLFGSMSQDELKASAKRVMDIPNKKIAEAVGDDKELTDLLIARKNDIGQRFGLVHKDPARASLMEELKNMAHDMALDADLVALDEFIIEIEDGVFAFDEKSFDESKIKRDNDGKFSSNGGGGSSGEGVGEAIVKAFKSKKEHIKHLLEQGTTPKDAMKALGWPSITLSGQAKSLGMKLEKKDGKYFGVPMTDAEKAELAEAAKAKKIAPAPTEKAGDLGSMAGQQAPKLNEVPKKEPEKKAAAAGNALESYPKFLGAISEGLESEDSSKVMQLLKDNPEFAKQFAEKASPAGKATLEKFIGTSIEEAGKKKEEPKKPAFPAPTEAEAAKAKKNAALKLAYIPGEKPSAGEHMANAESAISSFNKKWEGKDPTAEQIPEKVADFKALTNMVNGLASQENAAKAATAKAEAEKQAKAIKDKVDKEKADLQAKFDADPEFKLHYEAMADLMGGHQASQAFIQQATKKLKSSGLSKHLTPEAAMPIIAYSGSHYASLNDQLRKGQMTMAQYKFMKSLNAGLDRLPAHQETTYRRASISPEQFELYKPGMVVEERGFTSTSKNKNTWSGSTQYIVHGKSGRDISKISSHPSEAEVLFKSGSRFMVESVNGQTITLREV